MLLMELPYTFKGICRNIILFNEAQNTFLQLLYGLVTFPF